MKTIHAATLISLFLATLVLATEGEPACDLAIIASKKGIVTMNPEKPRAGALAIAGGRITAIDDAVEIRQLCRDAEEIQLTPEQTVLPGFIDSHSHFLPYGLAKTPLWIDVSSTNPFFADPFTPVLSQDQLKKKIQDSPQYKNKDVKLLLGAGFDSARTKSGEAPSLAFMDSISNDRPIFIWDASMHSANINQPTINWILEQNVCGVGSCDGSAGEAACQECLKPCEDIPERYRNSFCDGLLEESMMQKVLGLDAFSGGGKLLGTAVEEALEIAGETYASHGFTTGSDIAFGGILNAYLHLEDTLPLDMVISTTDVEGRKKIGRAAEKKPWLYGGAIKAWADGSVQGRTAFVSDAMLGHPINHGDMTDDNYVLAEVIEKAFQASYPVAIHTNGDAAIDVTLDLLEAAMARYPEARALRNTFIHAPMSDRRAFERMSDLNAIPTFLIQHPFFWGQPICESILGPARTREIYNPVGLAAQILPRFAFHSDAFVTPPDPLRMIWSGITRKVQDVQYLRDEGSGYTDACPEYLAQGQRVTVERSLRALTIDAAYQFSLEHEKGSLEIGKLADITILSQNPLDMEGSPDDLLQIDVLATLQRGRCYSWNSELECPTNP